MRVGCHNGENPIRGILSDLYGSSATFFEVLSEEPALLA